MKKFILLISFSLLIQNALSQEASTISKSTEVFNVSATDFHKLIKQAIAPQIIDIRTPREYQMGHIKGAININYYDPQFKDKIEAADLNKEKPILIYCRSGHRSGNALNIFKTLGFEKIVNLRSGINDWYRNKLPIANN